MKKCVITNQIAELPEQRKATICRLNNLKKDALSVVFRSINDANEARRASGLYNEAWQVSDLETYPAAMPYLTKPKGA